MTEIMVENETVSGGRQRRWSLVALAVIVAGSLFSVGGTWWDTRNYRLAMAEIEKDVDAGRHALAARKLAAILAWKPGSAHARYLLGTCEKARGRLEAASEAWARVPPDSPFTFSAIHDRIQLQIDRGRLADAERLIGAMLDDPRLDRLELPDAFGPVYRAQGRIPEAEQLIEARWDRIRKRGDGASEQAISLLRVYIGLREKVPTVEATRALLDEAAGLAPDDDRIWLGKANLAVRAGDFDEAARWLDACLRRRRDDLSVWRSRLNWAMATGRVREAREAMEHLPAAAFTPAEVPRLAAWFAAQQGNTAAERLALERVIAADPTDFMVLARLAELAVKDGQPERAAELEREKTEIDRLEARYQNLYERYQPERDAAEMARLALELGRQFEARALLTVAVAVNDDRVDLERDLARLDRESGTVERPGRALVELFEAELDDLEKSSPSTESRSRATGVAPGAGERTGTRRAPR